ncbi:MAG: hypothetical protein ABR884_03505 [Minisyncoccia bacterium]
MKRQRLTAIVTHIRPHLEELLAIYCFLNDHFADVVKGIYSYVRFTKVLFWDDLPEVTTREEWEEKGYVFVGRWGGKRDEHATLSQPRKEGQSAVTLIADELGISRDPKMQKLLQWTSSRDLKLGESMFELPAVLKMMNDFSWSPDTIWPWVVMAFEALYEKGNQHFDAIAPEAGTLWNKIVKEWLLRRFSGKLKLAELDIATSDAANAELFWLRNMPALKGILDFAQKVRAKVCGNPFEPHAIAAAIQAHPQFGYTLTKQWGFATLDALYQQSRDFNEIAARDYKAAKKIPIEINGRKVMAVVGQSDSLSFSRYARSSFGTQAEFHRSAAVVIVRNGNGNVSIFTDLGMPLDLAPVVEQLRVAELWYKGKEIPTDKALLRGEAAIPDCEEWYFFANGRMILNGSTTKSRRATSLPLTAITGIVFAGLRVKGFGLPVLSVTAPQPLASAPVTV